MTRAGSTVPHLPKKIRAAHAALVFFIAIAACGDSSGPRPTELEIVSRGRAERGLTLVLRAVTGPADTASAAAVAWSISPGDAGTLRGDTLRLLRAGRVEITALFDGRRATRTLEIAAPPMIVFDMIVDGNRDIYRAALDGGDVERLTTHPRDDHDPTAAGGTIVFVSNRDGNAELYSLPLAGGTERRLTSTSADEMHPSLSADGRRLAFARGVGLSKVYIANADAGGAVRPDPFHGHDGTLENAPAWHPDGQTLAFSSTAGGNPDIHRWNGGTAALLVGGSRGEFEPAWSPDGRQLAFGSTRSGDPDLYLLNIADGIVTRLTDRPGSDGYPAWLQDGRIVYVAFEGTTRTLRWLDPSNPGQTHTIPLPGEPGNPAPLPR